MDCFLAVTVAVLALAAPLYCRHTPSLSLLTTGHLPSLSPLSTEASTSHPPLTPSVIPLKPEESETSHKLHTKHLYKDEGKLWTKFPNTKHIVEILPLRHNTKLKNGKALAYILPKSKNRKQVGFGTIQDLSNIVFDSDESSDDFKGSSESDSTSSELNGSSAVYTNLENILDPHKQTGFNSENIIDSKLSDLVAFLKDNSDNGDLTYETVDGDHPDYHVHYITHRNHHNKLKHNDNIPSLIQEELHNVLKNKDQHHIKLNQIQHLLPGESPVPIAVPLGNHEHSDILTSSNNHGNSDFIVPKISDLILSSNNQENNNPFLPENIHEINNDFVVSGISDLIRPVDQLISNEIVPGNIHGNTNIIPHAVAVSIRYNNENPELHQIGVLKDTDKGQTHPSHRVIDDFNPVDNVHGHHSTHSILNINEGHVKGKETTLGHTHGSISHNSQVHDVAHNSTLELEEILDILSETDPADQHSHAPIKASYETNSLVDPTDQSESNDGSNNMSDNSSLNSDSDSIELFPELNDVQVQEEPTDNSNSRESESDSSSYSDEDSAAVNIEDNAKIISSLKPVVIPVVSGDTIEYSSFSEEDLGDVDGAEITVDGLEQHSLPDCLKIKKKMKKDCHGHKSYQLTFLFNR